MASEKQKGEGLAYAKMSDILRSRLKILAELLKDDKSPKEAILMTMTELNFFLEEIQGLAFVKTNLPDSQVEKYYDPPRSDASGSLGPDNAPSGSGS
jgi:hypothetical protein